MDGTKRPRGNPNWVKGGESPNPTGAPKVNQEFRRRARDAVDEHVLQRWVDEVVSMGKEWVKCSELLAAYGYGKPSQPLEHSGPDGGAVPGLVVTFVKAGGK